MLPSAVLASCFRHPLLPLVRRSQFGRSVCLFAARRAFHASAWRQALAVPPQQYDQVVATARVRMEERARLLDEMNADPSDAVGGRKRGQRLKALEPLHESWTEYVSLQEALDESLPLLEDPDESLRAMATEEVADLRQQINRLLSTTLPAHLLPPSTSSHLSCILELKSGQGGSEAAIFTREIRDMLIRFATSNRWKCSILESTSASDTAGADGLKDCTIRVEGDGAYGRLKWEAGVHRVQRVPLTESKGRTHTSTMAVIVLPIDENPTKDDLSYVDEKEVKMEFMRSSGAGGQHVNKTESAVRLTHLPTGIDVKCQEGRSQHANRETAWTILRGKVHAHRAKLAEEANRIVRASQIPGMDRADKIRTWNEPQDRVTDHRVPVTLNNLPSILSGEQLGDVIDSLEEWHLGARLKALMAGEDADIND